jgi:hypothetical protein
MATITTIAASDLITNSRADINTNFANLNSDKIETSTLDTDTSLAANSDAKIATQKAVKAYVDAGGNVNASTTAKGIVEEATSAEMIAGTAAGGTGARLFLNPSLVAETGNDKIVKTKSTGLLDSSIVPAASHKIGVTTRAGNTASGSQTIAHGLGKTPVFTRITAMWTPNAADGISMSVGAYDGSTQSCVYGITAASTGLSANDTSMIRLLQDDDEDPRQTATVAVDATNITLTWTRTGTTSAPNMNILWEVEG